MQRENPILMGDLLNRIVLALVCAIMLTGTAASAQLPQALKNAIEADLGRSLNDPYSAKYEFVTVGKFNVCGYVNAKNLYGAYVGRRPFSALYYKQAGRYHVVANIFSNTTDMSKLCN
jgi:hypothetical protein